jgi:hypothetical protein
MILVYSLLQGHPAATACEQLLRAHTGWFMPPAVLFEAKAVLTKVYGEDPALATKKLAQVASGPVMLVDLATTIGYKTLRRSAPFGGWFDVLARFICLMRSTMAIVRGDRECTLTPEFPRQLPARSAFQGYGTRKVRPQTFVAPRASCQTAGRVWPLPCRRRHPGYVHDPILDEADWRRCSNDKASRVSYGRKSAKLGGTTVRRLNSRTWTTCCCYQSIARW